MNWIHCNPVRGDGRMTVNVVAPSNSSSGSVLPGGQLQPLPTSINEPVNKISAGVSPIADAARIDIITVKTTSGLSKQVMVNQEASLIVNTLILGFSTISVRTSFTQLITASSTCTITINSTSSYIVNLSNGRSTGTSNYESNFNAIFSETISLNSIRFSAQFAEFYLTSSSTVTVMSETNQLISKCVPTSRVALSVLDFSQSNLWNMQLGIGGNLSTSVITVSIMGISHDI